MTGAATSVDGRRMQRYESMGGSMGGYLSAMRTGVFDELKTCITASNTSEPRLNLPITLAELFGNGSILSYESLTEHVCAHSVTHGWLLDSFEEHTGLRWAEEQWADPNGNGAAAGAIVGAYVLLILLLLGLCAFMCYKTTWCKDFCTMPEDSPVMSTMGIVTNTPAGVKAQKLGADEGDVDVEMTTATIAPTEVYSEPARPAGTVA